MCDMFVMLLLLDLMSPYAAEYHGCPHRIDKVAVLDRVGAAPDEHYRCLIGTPIFSVNPDG